MIISRKRKLGFLSCLCSGTSSVGSISGPAAEEGEEEELRLCWAAALMGAAKVKGLACSFIIQPIQSLI